MASTATPTNDGLTRYWPFGAGGLLGPLFATLLNRWMRLDFAVGLAMFVGFAAAMWVFQDVRRVPQNSWPRPDGELGVRHCGGFARWSGVCFLGDNAFAESVFGALTRLPNSNGADAPLNGDGRGSFATLATSRHKRAGQITRTRILPSEHVDQGIGAEQVDVAAKEVAYAGLRDAENGRSLFERPTVERLLHANHQIRTNQKVLGFLSREPQIAEDIAARRSDLQSGPTCHGYRIRAGEVEGV